MLNVKFDVLTRSYSYDAFNGYEDIEQKECGFDRAGDENILSDFIRRIFG